MANGKFALEYQKGAVNGASPLQLVVMLYDGALRFMEAGKHAMRQKNLERQNANLQRAQKIIQELTSCLDIREGGEIAQNLLSLYVYVNNELVQANIDDNPEPIDRCIRILSELRESWINLERSRTAPMAKAA